MGLLWIDPHVLEATLRVGPHPLGIRYLIPPPEHYRIVLDGSLEVVAPRTIITSRASFGSVIWPLEVTFTSHFGPLTPFTRAPPVYRSSRLTFQRPYSESSTTSRTAQPLGRSRTSRRHSNSLSCAKRSEPEGSFSHAPLRRGLASRPPRASPMVVAPAGQTSTQRPQPAQRAESTRAPSLLLAPK